MSKGQLVITAVVVEGRLPTMGPATVQAVCGRGRDRVRTALTTPHTNARAVRPDVEDRILRLGKNLTKRGFDAGAESIAAAHLAADPPPTCLRYPPPGAS
jgi:hypothetical protein